LATDGQGQPVPPSLGAAFVHFLLEETVAAAAAGGGDTAAASTDARPVAPSDPLADTVPGPASGTGSAPTV
jgi:hypothetical protein